ncbi:GNAT family N-acetyltransferase [Cellulophaga sp. E16_2]|uniref:GCN5-related N-acetyltransferase n=1 Tax=Cellulophaga algicola (strain DSM 14237 / IC166 / ACAM 630) TaxID=688270 RepID=E6XBU4_CELAD|nr:MULTISPECIES: GNAT family N-acetyltransferase [Cellulophaga]ADV48946.1 GCN5-related N-acetyltransferase [Cellulophaga algicola DSM 14237]MBO0591417.1 GNAT family N-acetyltransferase [Cellulophaga sp. E16_2]
MLEREIYTIEPIAIKDSWRLCNFAVANADRLKRYFPKTLAHNLTPNLSEVFVSQKVKELEAKTEFLFTLKEKETRTIIGLIYVKKIDKALKQAELAYCIGYDYEGKGIISKTVRYISNWAHEELGLTILQIITHKTNIGSVKVAENNKYTWIKTLPKEHTPPNEAPLDMELYELHYER